MKNCVLAYSQAPILQWTKAFGEVYIQMSCTVKQNLLIVAHDYYKRVYLEEFRTKPKKKDYPFVKKKLRGSSTTNGENILNTKADIRQNFFILTICLT